MLKQKIKYENFEGVAVEEEVYFNLTRSELIKIQAKHGGKELEKKIQEAIDTENFLDVLELLEDLVLTAYGQKSEDGKRFVKTPAQREEFSQSLAYDALLESFYEGDGKGLTDFVKGITAHIKGIEIPEQ